MQNYYFADYRIFIDGRLTENDDDVELSVRTLCPAYMRRRHSPARRDPAACVAGGKGRYGHRLSRSFRRRKIHSGKAVAETSER